MLHVVMVQAPKGGISLRRMSVLLAGLVVLVMVAGCTPRYAYHGDHHHRHPVRSYYLADGTHVKVLPNGKKVYHSPYKVQKVIVKKRKRH